MKKHVPLEELAANGMMSGVELDSFSVPTEPFDPASISVEGRIVPMDTLLRRLRQGSIRIAPTFQRDYMWDAKRRSLLIESLMLNIPLPMFYVSANENGTWDVVDGLQRLTTIRNFLLGEELNSKGEKVVPEAQPFELRELEFWGEPFNGKTFRQIQNDAAALKIVNNIMETELRFTVINPGTPEDVKRNIFKRINTGGMPLTPQEIRHALYQGESTKLLQRICESETFKLATDDSIDDSRMVARELILRAIAFAILGRENFNGDMDKFLSQAMRVINCAPELSTANLEKIFKNQEIPTIAPIDTEQLFVKIELAIKRSHEFFGSYAFRKSLDGMRKTPINKALFEIWIKVFSEMPESDFQLIKSRKSILMTKYKALLNDRTFDRSISRDSSAINGVRDRYKEIDKLLLAVLDPENASFN